MMWSKANYGHFIYLSLLEQLDIQFNHLLKQLKHKGYLHNAEVFVISDHGDSFRLEDDKLAPMIESQKQVLNVDAFGHGTNVLNQSQSEILLAYQKYVDGSRFHQSTLYQGLYSIIDIVPSINRTLDEPPPKNIDGQALPLSRAQLNKDRFIFVDSSVPIKSIDTSLINLKYVFSETMDTYIADTNGQPVLTNDAYEQFIFKQHRAVYYKNWQFAFLPDQKDLIIVDLIQHKWAYLNEYQGSAPWRRMLKKLCTHYKSEIRFSDEDKCIDSQSIN
ncbi:hypothetical protein FE810_14705 [Thalassotalea litorea]|uniref:DUF229 domain-containing protein n=1 Tax=Thalassotalea litorea TaxID=2020715 RepID=A0A5R9IG08_9GAMM|nr:hypothetical protein [Thalassotalea litorea]TLU61484.1 hypothetical protein FE810_14705 [Thalassotalea litorea]